MGKFPVFPHQSWCEEMTGAQGSAGGDSAVNSQSLSLHVCLVLLFREHHHGTYYLCEYCYCCISHHEFHRHFIVGVASTAALNNSILNNATERDGGDEGLHAGLNTCVQYIHYRPEGHFALHDQLTSMSNQGTETSHSGHKAS